MGRQLDVCLAVYKKICVKFCTYEVFASVYWGCLLGVREGKINCLSDALDNLYLSYSMSSRNTIQFPDTQLVKDQSSRLNSVLLCWSLMNSSIFSS